MRHALLDFLRERYESDLAADTLLTVERWCELFGITPAWWRALLRGDQYFGVVTLGKVVERYGDEAGALVLDYCRDIARTRHGGKGRRPDHAVA